MCTAQVPKSNVFFQGQVTCKIRFFMPGQRTAKLAQKNRANVRERHRFTFLRLTWL